MDYKFSVIIPLYNKEAEVGRAIRSALSQTVAPVEIVVVDDGSTDRSAEAVLGCGSPLVKLVSQANAGETAARNRGMAEASGDYYALLDADDEWESGFLAAIAGMIDEYPECGIYCTGFDIVRSGKITPARTPSTRGVVADYFEESMTRFVATSSSSVLPAKVVAKTGGFPEGMKLGGDQYMWTKIALAYPVCFTPERLAKVYATAANRSAAIYTPERTAYSFRDFYDEGNPVLNEYIARVELGKAITATVRGATEEGLAAERDFAYNRRSRRLWRRLWVLNRLPPGLRRTANDLYGRLAWTFAKKGL